jgi:hypothetical protein
VYWLVILEWLMTESSAGRSGNAGEGRRIGSSSAIWAFDSRSGVQTFFGPVSYGQSFLQSVRDQKYRSGVEFYLKIRKMWNVKVDFVIRQFQSISEPSRRQKPHEWRLWMLFCSKNATVPAEVVSLKVPS